MKRILFSALVLLAVFSCGKEDNGGESTASAEVTVPTNVKLHSATDYSLTFQWTAVEGAETYGWKLTLDGADAKSGSVNKRNVEITDLTPGTTYFFSVCAKGSGKSSEYCSPVEASTTGTAPTPPDPNATVICTDASLVLELDAVPVLGTSGLIQAYRAAAAEAIQVATIVEKTVDGTIDIAFPFPAMNAVMKVVKDIEPQIVDQGYADDNCTMKLTIRQSQMPVLKSRLEKILELKIIET